MAARKFVGLCRITAIFLAMACTANAETITGQVVGVDDGDSITVLQGGKVQHKIRLAEIDAPEKSQPFGQQAKQSLSQMCFGKQATIEDRGREFHGRPLGRVWCDGVDVTAEQVRGGMAWVYDRYVTDRSLYSLQDAARAARHGLWADADPVPPWEWRKSKKRQGN